MDILNVSGETSSQATKTNRVSCPAGNPPALDLFGQPPFVPATFPSLNRTLPTANPIPSTVDDQVVGCNNGGLQDLGTDHEPEPGQDPGSLKKKKFLYGKFDKEDLKPFPVRSSPRVSKPSTRYPDTVYYK